MFIEKLILSQLNKKGFDLEEIAICKAIDTDYYYLHYKYKFFPLSSPKKQFFHYGIFFYNSDDNMSEIVERLAKDLSKVPRHFENMNENIDFFSQYIDEQILSRYRLSIRANVYTSHNIINQSFVFANIVDDLYDFMEHFEDLNYLSSDNYFTLRKKDVFGNLFRKFKKIFVSKI